MNTFVKDPIDLVRGGILRVEDGRDLLVHVWEGEVWLTQEGDVRDHLVQAKQWFRLDRKGPAVLQALARSRLTLSAPEPDPRSRRPSLLGAWG